MSIMFRLHVPTYANFWRWRGRCRGWAPLSMWVYLHPEMTWSPQGYKASPNFGICDTTLITSDYTSKIAFVDMPYFCTWDLSYFITDLFLCINMWSLLTILYRLTHQSIAFIVFVSDGTNCDFWKRRILSWLSMLGDNC